MLKNKVSKSEIMPYQDDESFDTFLNDDEGDNKDDNKEDSDSDDDEFLEPDEPDEKDEKWEEE